MHLALRTSHACPIRRNVYHLLMLEQTPFDLIRILGETVHKMYTIYFGTEMNRNSTFCNGQRCIVFVYIYMNGTNIKFDKYIKNSKYHNLI